MYILRYSVLERYAIWQGCLLVYSLEDSYEPKGFRIQHHGCILLMFVSSSIIWLWKQSGGSTLQRIIVQSWLESSWKCYTPVFVSLPYFQGLRTTLRCTCPSTKPPWLTWLHIVISFCLCGHTWVVLYLSIFACTWGSQYSSHFRIFLVLNTLVKEFKILELQLHVLCFQLAYVSQIFMNQFYFLIGQLRIYMWACK